MDYLPIFLDLRHHPCLVIGGGQVAARKVALLLQAEAAITVVAPELCPALQDLLAQGRIVHQACPFAESHVQGAHLVVAATDEQAVNAQASALCQALAIPVNVVDQPELCSFIMPAIVDRSPVLIAVSTGGSSPVLARLLRARLEAVIPFGYGRLASFAAQLRETVKQRLPQARRLRFWEKILQGPAAEQVLAGQEATAHKTFAAALAQETRETAPIPGEVYLVGAGPGDPELLTLRALRLIQQADVAVYDRLVAPAILELSRRDAERLFVGKTGNRVTLSQSGINRLLIDLARQGKRVLRLKGGDPFVFGRGGEELQALRRAAIPFQVVPGITAATGCAAYAGIPLTHRDHAESCIFVSGHGSVSDSLDWHGLSRPRQTVVFYMGFENLAMICAELIQHGLPASTPAALVVRGTTAAQQVHLATLAKLPAQLVATEIGGASLLIVGEVVSLREQLAWFEPPGTA